MSSLNYESSNVESIDESQDAFERTASEDLIRYLNQIYAEVARQEQLEGTIARVDRERDFISDLRVKLRSFQDMMKLKLPDRPLRTPIAHSLRQEIDEIIDYLCQGDLHVFVQELAKIEKKLRVNYARTSSLVTTFNHKLEEVQKEREALEESLHTIEDSLLFEDDSNLILHGLLSFLGRREVYKRLHIPFSALKFEEVLGQGENGRVTKAMLGIEEVVVKELHLSKGESARETKQTIKRVLREAQISVSIQHSRILSLLGVCLDHPSLGALIVYPHVSYQMKGEESKQSPPRSVSSLFHYLHARRSLLCGDEEILLSFLMDISKGMAYLHFRGISHGDLSSRNTLMNSERRLVVSDQPFSDEAALYTNKKNKIKICDFGEAKYFEVEDASMDLDDWEEAYISLMDEELAQIRDEALKKTAIIDMNENTEKHYPSDDLSETSDPREPNDDVEDTGRRVVSPAGEDEVAAPFPPALVEDLERRRLEDLQATGADQAVQGYMWDHSMFKQLAVELMNPFHRTFIWETMTREDVKGYSKDILRLMDRIQFLGDLKMPHYFVAVYKLCERCQRKMQNRRPEV